MNQDSSRPGLASIAGIDSFDLQTIHIGQRYILQRTHHQQPLVIKSVKNLPSDGGAAAALRKEFSLLENRDLPGVVKVIGLTESDAALALVMADAGQSNLARLLEAGPLSLDVFFPIALQIACAVAVLHDAGILHCNLQPANVAWNIRLHQATLVDFGSAVAMAAVTQGHAPMTVDNVTSPYSAPEQTGRTARAIDARADLYAVGIVLYECLLGAPPFTARDPLELSHAHLARVPKAPHAINPAIPRVLSDIVLRLLEKDPEHRYITAAALVADLETAGADWSANGSIMPFPLASHNAPSQLPISDTLLGRDAQVDALRAAFDRVRTSTRELILVAGAPGIGKSVLIAGLANYVTARNGYFIAGKFDQLQRSVPYEGLVQAFRMLVLQLLTESDGALTHWRDAIGAAIAPNGQILVDMIPEIESIIGPQAPVRELPPLESKNRFNHVLTSFVNTLARPAHPFVLFLDDLQWVDAASLQLIEQWLHDHTRGHLLLAGAYRNDEVGLVHPLALALVELRSAGVPVSEIVLGALDRDQIAQLIATGLNRPADQCLSLADIISNKTGGNPFFIRQLLRELHMQGLIRFATSTASWEWDLDEIARAPVSDNVLDLMVQAIGRLPVTTRNLIQVAACIGYRADLATLANVSGNTPETAINLLRPALQDCLLLPLRGTPDTHMVLQFVHDRVQQAAYSLLSETRRASLHLDIGNYLLSGARMDGLDALLFDIVHHMNRGEALIADPAEHIHLAERNLAAARKAKAAAAYQAAFDYLSKGRGQLPDMAWQTLPKLTFAMHREFAECAYLTGQHAVAEELLQVALEHAPTPVAKAELYSLRILAATVASDWAGAFRWGREGLAVFGHAWPVNGLAAVNETELEAVIENVGKRSIEALVDAPEMDNEETQACMRLLAILGPPAYFSGSEVLAFLIARGTNLSLQHGPTVYSAYVYVFYGALHNSRTGDYDVGYAFGKLALNLARRFGNRAEESRALEVFALVVQPWRAPLHDSLALMREGHRAGVESGELAYAAFNLCGILINGLSAGMLVSELLANATIGIEFATRHQNRTAAEICAPFLQFARMLTGKTSTGFNDALFDEARFLKSAEGNQTAIGQYWVARLQAAFLAGDDAMAQHSAREGAKCVGAGILGMVTCAEHALYTALTLSKEWNTAAPERQQDILSLVTDIGVQFNHWTAHCAENFKHKQCLVNAELARMRGARWTAMEYFDEAINAASAQNMMQDAALANELAARLFLSHGQTRHATAYLYQAIDCYRRWGASVKADALYATHADDLAGLPHGAPPDQRQRQRESAFTLDALSLIKATQAIAAETDAGLLVERILQIAIEVAGAQTGVLLLGEASALQVRGRIAVEKGTAAVLEEPPLADGVGLPRSIIRYVARTRGALVLDNAALDERFAGDAEVQTLRMRSVLCVPLSKQLRVVGMLYLDNNAMAGAFTTARVEVVQALAAQAAISLENSALLDERARTERELRQLATDLSNENRRKTEFIATLAHELRNPLAPIRTGLDLMRLSGNNNLATTKVHDMMGRQLNQMVHLIDDLLDIARINSGKVQLKKERIELRDTISTAVEAALPAIRAAQQTLDVALPDMRLLLDADPTRLAQVFSNLLTNATKYTPREGRIAIVAQPVDGSNVSITITDSGIGIPAHALLEVFDMFNQVSRDMGRSQGGLGIGLSLVRSLVQMHGGDVKAASAGEGAGSTFTVRLPLAEHAVDSVHAPTATDPNDIRAKTLKVLVADDNVDAANMLLALLELLGHTVVLAHDGKQALAMAQANDLDLAILDIGMPELNGYEVAEEIRRLPNGAHVLLAALSGWGTDGDRIRSKNAGFDTHLTKPAGIAEINALVAMAIGS